MAGCFIFPTVEAAALELSLLLADREREIGGSKTQVIYGHLQDPALDRMAKSISATGVDTQPKTVSEFQNIATWFAEAKPKALLFALAEDDRFTGRVHDTAAIRATLFAEGARTPVMNICFGSADWRKTMPRPFEIRLYELSLGSNSVALAIVGERLRLEPRLAPLSFTKSQIEAVSSGLKAWTAENVLGQAISADLARATIEVFEAKLPAPFMKWWGLASPRMLDRAIITTTQHDGSWLIDQLRPKLVAAGAASDLVEHGLFSLSGCVTGDERRQEWLRSRGDDALKIRGAVHISLELIQALPMPVWERAFQL